MVNSILIAEESLLVDLQRFLVPTTTRLINAISQVEPMVLERTRSPVLMELARASLDFMLSTDPRTGKLVSKKEYGRPMKPFFIEMPNFWAWSDNLGR